MDPKPGHSQHSQPQSELVATPCPKTFPHLASTMSTYNRWVKDSFKHILTEACDEYLKTNDRGSEKTRSIFLDRITREIEEFQTKAKDKVPDNLRKVRQSSW